MPKWRQCSPNRSKCNNGTRGSGKTRQSTLHCSTQSSAGQRRCSSFSPRQSLARRGYNTCRSPNSPCSLSPSPSPCPVCSKSCKSVTRSSPQYNTSRSSPQYNTSTFKGPSVLAQGDPYQSNNAASPYLSKQKPFSLDSPPYLFTSDFLSQQINDPSSSARIDPDALRQSELINSVQSNPNSRRARLKSYGTNSQSYGTNSQSYGTNSRACGDTRQVRVPFNRDSSCSPNNCSRSKSRGDPFRGSLCPYYDDCPVKKRTLNSGRVSCDNFSKVCYPRDVPVTTDRLTKQLSLCTPSSPRSYSSRSKERRRSKERCRCSCKSKRKTRGTCVETRVSSSIVSPENGPSQRFLDTSSKLGKTMSRFESHFCPWEADITVSGTVRGHCTSTAAEVARRMTGHFKAEGERYTTDSIGTGSSSFRGTQKMSLGMLDDGSRLDFSRNNEPSLKLQKDISHKSDRSHNRIVDTPHDVAFAKSMNPRRSCRGSRNAASQDLSSGNTEYQKNTERKHRHSISEIKLHRVEETPTDESDYKSASEMRGKSSSRCSEKTPYNVDTTVHDKFKSTTQKDCSHCSERASCNDASTHLDRYKRNSLKTRQQAKRDCKSSQKSPLAGEECVATLDGTIRLNVSPDSYSLRAYPPSRTNPGKPIHTSTAHPKKADDLKSEKQYHRCMRKGFHDNSVEHSIKDRASVYPSATNDPRTSVRHSSKEIEQELNHFVFHHVGKYCKEKQSPKTYNQENDEETTDSSETTELKPLGRKTKECYEEDEVCTSHLPRSGNTKAVFSKRKQGT